VDSHSGAPKREAMAMRRDVLSSLVPTEEQGIAFKYAPACDAVTANIGGHDPPGFVWQTAHSQL
jgi:hypothetical protein